MYVAMKRVVTPAPFQIPDAIGEESLAATGNKPNIQKVSEAKSKVWCSVFAGLRRDDHDVPAFVF